MSITKAEADAGVCNRCYCACDCCVDRVRGKLVAATPMPSPATCSSRKKVGTGFALCQLAAGHAEDHANGTMRWARAREVDFECLANRPDNHACACCHERWRRQERAAPSSGEAGPSEVVRAAIVEAAFRWVKDTGSCHFCDHGSDDGEGGDLPHNEECPFSADGWRDESKARAMADQKESEAGR